MTANRKGYDPTSVAMVMAGYPVELTVPERREVVHRLKQRGTSESDIASFLGVTAKVVNQDLLRWQPQPSAPRLEHGTLGYAELAATAHDLARSLRDDDPRVVAWQLDGLARADLVSMAMTALAMVDPSSPVDELLAWTEPFADGIAS